MEMNVFDLAQMDTSLKRKSHNEYAGPCPRCGGTDRFVVHLTKKEHGAWMCRGCWDPQVKGWGDDIQYLREMRGMSFTAAKKLLARETDTLLERVDRLKPYVEPTSPGRVELPNQKWQAWASKYIEQAVARLWSSAGTPGLDYLHARGLNDATIRSFQLGYAAEQEDQDTGERIPLLVIPWHAGQQAENKIYWCIKLRDIRPGIPHHERYRNVMGSSLAGLYGGELLSRKRPTFLVEGELDAITIAQECSDLPISVVASGGLDCTRVPKWIGRLARKPHVLVAYDREPRGEEKAQTWLNILEHNAMRYRPLPPCKDVNDMLVQGYSIHAWVEGALWLLSERNAETHVPTIQDQDGEASPVQPAASEPLPGIVSKRNEFQNETAETPAASEPLPDTPLFYVRDVTPYQATPWYVPGEQNAVTIAEQALAWCFQCERSTDVVEILSCHAADMFEQQPRQAVTWLEALQRAYAARDQEQLTALAQAVDIPGPELLALLPALPEAETQEQFLAYVNQLATELEQTTGAAWSVRLLPTGFTLDDRVREIQQVGKEQEREAWFAARRVRAR